MPGLTSNLGSPSSPARVIDPGPQANSLATVVGGLGDLMGTLDRASAENARRQTARAQSRADTTADVVATMDLEFRAESEARLRGSGGLDILDRAETQQLGVEQGNSSSAQTLRLETEALRFIRDNPDQAAEFADAAESRGLNSFMFRNLQAEEAGRESEEEVRLNQQQESYTWALNNLNPAILEDKTYAQIVEMGTNEQGIRASLDRTREMGDIEAVNFATSAAYLRLQPLADNFSQAWAQANGDLAQQEVLRGILPDLVQGIQLEASRITSEMAEAGGLTPQALERINQGRDDTIAGLSLFSTDPSFDGVRGDMLSRANTELDIDLLRVAPTLARAQRILGPSGGALLMEMLGMAAQDPEALSVEFRDYVSGAQTPQATEGAANQVRLWNTIPGEDVTPEGMLHYAARVNTAGNTVAAGNAPTETVTQFTDDLVGWADISRSSNVFGQINSTEFAQTVGVMFTPQRTQQLLALHREDPAAAAPAVNALLEEGSRMLQVGQHKEATDAAFQGFSIVFNEGTAQYEIDDSRFRETNQRGQAGFASGRLGRVNLRGSTPPASLTRHVQSLNTLMTSLTSLQSEVGSDGMSTMDTRRALNDPIRFVSGNQDISAPALEAPVEVSEHVTPPSRNFDQFLGRLAEVESSGNPNAEASTSSASGLFQFTEGTWRDATRGMSPEVQNLDSRFDPEISRLVVSRTTESNFNLLKDVLERDPSDGELYAAHFLGRRGALRLLDRAEENPNQLAAEVFPRPAQANPNIFTEGLTLDGLIEVLEAKMSG